MNRIAAGLVMMGVVASCDTVSVLAAANKTDPTLVWPKNSQFTCRGVLTHEQGTYRLTPDEGMLAWCDADINDKDRGRALDTCKLGGRCEIKGIIKGHGTFGWVQITSIVGFAHAAIAAQGRLDKPFLIGGYEVGGYEGDACGAIGEVTGLDPAGDGFLSVRSGPGGKPFSEVYRLHNGDAVYLCGKEGPWFQVVFHENRKVHESCGVSTPWPRRRAYNGPCRRGWAHSRYIKVTAE